MTEPYAKVIADSISPDGVRLTTFEVRTWRFVLAEFNTHRMFSRNSASSRAIPITKQLERIARGPAVPVAWPAEQKGMQGGAELEGADDPTAKGTPWYDATLLWSQVLDHTRDKINEYVAYHDAERRLHKSLLNRLLEPFMWHTIVVTSTGWENFFHQRCSPLAQPEIRVTAEQMREAYEKSEPQPLREGMWHLPYIEFGNDDYAVATRLLEWSSEDASPDAVRANLVKISAARCARVSYLTQDGKRDIEKDLELYERLVTADPPHWSPLEHVATPWPWNRQEGCIHFGQDENADHDTFTCVPLFHLPRVGNLVGWRSLRTTVEAEKEVVTFR